MKAFRVKLKNETDTKWEIKLAFQGSDDQCSGVREKSPSEREKRKRKNGNGIAWEKQASSGFGIDRLGMSVSSRHTKCLSVEGGLSVCRRRHKRVVIHIQMCHCIRCIRVLKTRRQRVDDQGEVGRK